MASNSPTTAAFLTEYGYRRLVDLSGLVMRRAAQRSAGSLSTISKAAHALAALIESDGASVAAVNAAVAEAATTAVLLAYEESVNQNRNAMYDRRHNRMPRGALKRALEEYTARGDSLGVHFVNQVGLDAAAKQWARLAYGAGGLGQPSHGTYPLRFLNIAIDRYGGLHDSAQARPAFQIPSGIWLDASGNAVTGGGRGDGDAFFPGRIGGNRNFSRGTGTHSAGFEWHNTKGIEARNFFEAGLAVIAEQLPVAYADLLKSWIQRGFRPAAAEG